MSDKDYPYLCDEEDMRHAALMDKYADDEYLVELIRDIRKRRHEEKTIRPKITPDFYVPDISLSWISRNDYSNNGQNALMALEIMENRKKQKKKLDSLEDCIKIRIAVAVDHKGDWCASGWSNEDEPDAQMGAARECLGCDIEESWVTAYVPKPGKANEVFGELETEEKE